MSLCISHNLTHFALSLQDTGFLGATGRDQKTSLVALYGPRTTVVVALDDGVFEFTYGCTPEGCQLDDGTWAPWICSRKDIKISEDCKIFAPANMRAAQELPGYKVSRQRVVPSAFNTSRFFLALPFALMQSIPPVSNLLRSS